MKKALFIELLVLAAAFGLAFAAGNFPQSGVLLEMYCYPDVQYAAGDPWSAVVRQNGMNCYIETKTGSVNYFKANENGAEVGFIDPAVNTARLSFAEVQRIKELCRYIKLNYNTGEGIIQHDGTYMYLYFDNSYYQGCSGPKYSDEYTYELMMDKRFSAECRELIERYIPNKD